MPPQRREELLMEFERSGLPATKFAQLAGALSDLCDVGAGAPAARRWRLRHNDRLRLLCDASKFIAALSRLHQPERGGFLTFSRSQAA